MNYERAMQLTEEGVMELAEALKGGQSESLTRCLELMARFHEYSFRNTMLIAIQRPDASYVAGFRTWKQFNRFVRKGEKGIAILAPVITRKRQQTQREGQCRDEENPGQIAVLGFRVVHVFDVSQTEGDTLPELDRINGDPGDWLGRLHQIVQDCGVRVEYADMPPGVGGAARGNQLIRINNKLSPGESFATLVHEFAHAVLHARPEDRQGKSKAVIETEAESIAFVVSRAFGIEAMNQSRDYIHLHRGDVRLFSSSLAIIQETSGMIIDRLLSAESALPSRRSLALSA